MLDKRPSWVAIMTYHNAEMTVARNFDKADPPIEYYLPMLAVRDKRAKGKDLPEKPMFPCYLFARINAKQVYQTRTTKGVIYIVSSNHSIIQVPDSEIEAIRRFEASERKIHVTETSKLVKGAQATILSGEFAGMHGRLVKDCEDGNFSVQISVLNMSFVVKVKRSELRAPVTDELSDSQPGKSENHHF